MAGKRLYIHAGSGKTGTSSLQYFLYLHRKVLLEKYGLYVPDIDAYRIPGDDYKHQMGTITGRMRSAFTAELRANSSHDILVSSETLCAFPDMARRFFALCRESVPLHEMRVILYVRKIDDLVRSAYNQTLKYARPEMVQHSFSEFFDFWSGEERPGNALLVSRSLDLYCREVGRENLTVRLFDREHLKNRNIIDDFFDLLGVDLDPELDTRVSRNVRIDDAALSYLSPGLFTSGFLHESLPVSRELLRHIGEVPGQSADAPGQQAVVAEEIEALDGYLPGYKEYCSRKGISMAGPDVDSDPYRLLTLGLLYRLLDDVREIRERQKYWFFPVRWMRRKMKRYQTHGVFHLREGLRLYCNETFGRFAFYNALKTWYKHPKQVRDPKL